MQYIDEKKNKKSLSVVKFTTEVIYFMYFFLNLFTAKIFFDFGNIRNAFAIICALLSLVCLLFEKAKIPKISVYFLLFSIVGVVGEILEISNFGTEYLSPYLRNFSFVPVLIFFSAFGSDKFLKKFIDYNSVYLIISIILFIGDLSSFGRFSSTFEHPNYFAAYALIAVLVSIFLFRINKISFFRFSLSLLVNLTFIVASGSRTTAIITVIILGYNYFSRKGSPKSILIKGVGGLIIAFVILLVFQKFGSTILSMRIFDLDYGISENRVNSFEWRILKWKYTFSYWKGIPGILFGFGERSDMHYPYVGFPMHNEYLRFLFNYGIMGTFFFLKFIGEYLRILFKKKILNSAYRKLYISFILIVFVSSLTSNIFLASETYSIYLFFIVSIVFNTMGEKNEI